jgi:peptidoglycan/LPS O-acetylase OafA/YrhL
MTSITSVDKPRRTVVGLDMLRLLAALLVVCYHIFFFSWVERRGDGGISDAVNAQLSYVPAMPYTSWGWVGVDLFFVISGYVILMSSQGKRARDFAIGRFSRLAPALLCFSTLTLIIVLAAHLTSPQAAVLAWVRTIILFPVGPWIDGVIWTLTIEAIFYFGIFLVLLHRRDRIALYSRAALAVISVFWLAVFCNETIGGFGHAGAWLENFAESYKARVVLLSTGPFFLLGMFAFEAQRSGLNKGLALCGAAAFLCCLMALHATAINMEGTVVFHASWLVPMSVWTGLVICCGFSIWWERRRPPGRRVRIVARQLGLMTYPLYLVHDIPGGLVLGFLFRAGINRWLAAGLTIMLAMAVSYGFAKIIEPALRESVASALRGGWLRMRRGYFSI